MIREFMRGGLVTETEMALPARRGFGSDMLLTIILSALALVAAFIGLAMHLWMLNHLRLTSDESIVGLMAIQIRHGHMFTFFWGQPYGGAEPYLVAPWTALFGDGPVALNSVPTVLAGVTAVLVWRVGRRLFGLHGAALAVMAGIAVWVWPDALVFNSTTELGFRGVALLAGVATLLLAMRVGDRPTVVNLVGVGLVSGIGWWSSPEIIYFLLPAALLLLARWRSLMERGWRLLLILAGAVVGASPWLATNVRTGFLSLRRSSSPDYVHATYAGRLSVFFSKSLPMMLGLRAPASGTWLWGHAGQALYGLALSGLVALCLVSIAGYGAESSWSKSALRGLAIGLVAFPFLFSLFPATSFWQQGQYGIYVVPFIVLVSCGGISRLLSLLAPGGRQARHHVRRGASAGAASVLVASVVVVTVTIVSVASFQRAWLAGHPGRFLTGWPGPSVAAQHAARTLEADGIHDGYAQYWVAYDLDYLSHQHLEITDPYSDRWVAEYYRVRNSANPAWLFYAPDQVPAASDAFESTVLGPYGWRESHFLDRLDAIHVPYRIIHAGFLDAVIPVRPVAQQEIGIPGPYWR